MSSVFIEMHIWGGNQIIFLLRNCHCTSACSIVQDYQELLRNRSPASVPAKADECLAQTSRAFSVVGHRVETGQGFSGGDPCSAQRAVEVLLSPPAAGRHSCSGVRSRSGTVSATPARLLQECHQVAVMGPDGGMEPVPSLGVLGAVLGLAVGEWCRHSGPGRALGTWRELGFWPLEGQQGHADSPCPWPSAWDFLVLSPRRASSTNGGPHRPQTDAALCWPKGRSAPPGRSCSTLGRDRPRACCKERRGAQWREPMLRV